MRLLFKTAPVIIICFLFSCQLKSQIEPPTGTNEPPSNNCLVIDETPPNVTNVANIAAADEPGERIKIRGIVYESDGKTPAKNVIMYFYHTNAKGTYAKRGKEPRSSFAWWHGYNRGWLKTNERGEYEINTIKPAPYPARIEPAHIHCIVKAPTQKKCYYIGDFVFKGDALATEKYWYAAERFGHPRYGGVRMSAPANGISVGERNIILYAQYDIASSASGLTIGEDCPAFDPQHIWGADKGSKACPMCKYGFKPGILAWINTDSWENVARLARALDKEISEKGTNNLKAFIIYMNPNGLLQNVAEEKLVQFSQAAGLKNVAVLYVSSPIHKTTSALYRINPDKNIKNTIFIYKKRKVIYKYINFEANNKNLQDLRNKFENY